MQNNNLPTSPIEKIYNTLKNNINSIFFSGDISFIITIVLFFTIISIGSIFMFEVILPNVRTQFTNNIFGAILSILFIIIIFKFMDAKISILGKDFDFGLIFYIAIIFGLLILFSN